MFAPVFLHRRTEQGSVLFRLTLVVTCSIAGACSSPAPEQLPACVVPVGDSPSRGPADAWVTIVEFGDFQCPYCGAVEPTLHQVDTVHPGVRWVWKDFPLPQHSRALPAAIAAECASAQGQFWQMHDLLYQHQNALGDTDLVAYAEQLGLDLGQWQTCVTEAQPNDHISADLQEATHARVDGTPSFFINGTALVGNLPLADFLGAITEAESRAQASGLPQSSYYASRENQGCL